jgi:diguanylate cyclase (GGDEF)-like protein
MAQPPDGFELLAHVVEAATLLSQETEADSFFERVLTSARRLTGAEAGTIFLRRGDELRFVVVQNDVLAARAGQREVQRLLQEDALAVDASSLAGQVALSGAVVNVADAYSVGDEDAGRFNPAVDRKTGYVTCSVLAVPLEAPGGEIVGVLELLNALADEGAIVPFDPAYEVPVRWLAAQAAAVAVRAAGTSRIRRDELTGLPARDHFLQRIDEEILRYTRFGHPFAVMLVSLDRLDELAEREGREVADAVVRGVGARLTRLSRQLTVLARYDADTFGVLLPSATAEAALGYGRRIKRTVEGEPIGLDPLTATVAVVSVPNDGTRVDAVIELAEFRRREGRRLGGNTIRSR